MSTFVLVPGAGGLGWYWHRLVPELRARGHDAIAVDIAQDDANLGLPEYADIVRAAIGERLDGVLVGQSLGAFTVAMVADRTPLAMIVLLNAMIPVPGETPGAWWDATGQSRARADSDAAAGRDHEFSEQVHFLHDVPAEVLASGPQQRVPSATPFGQPCDFARWPDIPIRVVVGRDDRFFPVDFQRQLASQRLGVEADEIDGGHLVALSNPAGLADRLNAYAGELR